MLRAHYASAMLTDVAQSLLRGGITPVSNLLVQIHLVTSLALNMPHTDPVKSDTYIYGIQIKNLNHEILAEALPL